MQEGRCLATRVHSFLTNPQVTGAPGAPGDASQRQTLGGSRRILKRGSADRISRVAARPCDLQSGIFLGTQRRQVHRREDSVNNWQPLFSKLRT